MVTLTVAIIWTFGSTTLDGYLQGKLERAMAGSFPEYSLHIGSLAYTPSANRLVVESLSLRSTNGALSVGWLAATGLHLTGLWGGKLTPVDLLAHTTLEATNLRLDSIRSSYRVRCARVRASVPSSELLVEGTELGPRIGDEELFARDPFRTTRYRVLVPECRVSGIAYDELLQGNPTAHAESMCSGRRWMPWSIVTSSASRT